MPFIASHCPPVSEPTSPWWYTEPLECVNRALASTVPKTSPNYVLFCVWLLYFNSKVWALFVAILFFMRQGLIIEPKVAPNLWSSCLSFPSVEIMGICHQTQLRLFNHVFFFNFMYLFLWCWRVNLTLTHAGQVFYHILHIYRLLKAEGEMGDGLAGKVEDLHLDLQ